MLCNEGVRLERVGTKDSTKPPLLRVLEDSCNIPRAGNTLGALPNFKKEDENIPLFNGVKYINVFRFGKTFNGFLCIWLINNEKIQQSLKGQV